MTQIIKSNNNEKNYIDEKVEVVWEHVHDAKAEDRILKIFEFILRDDHSNKGEEIAKSNVSFTLKS